MRTSRNLGVRLKRREWPSASAHHGQVYVSEPAVLVQFHRHALVKIPPPVLLEVLPQWPQYAGLLQAGRAVCIAVCIHQSWWGIEATAAKTESFTMHDDHARFGQRLFAFVALTYATNNDVIRIGDLAI